MLRCRLTVTKKQKSPRHERCRGYQLTHYGSSESADLQRGRK